MAFKSRTKWPRGLRRGSAAARLMGLQVQILAVAYIFFSCDVMCCWVEISATGWSLAQRSPTDCGVPN